MNGYDEHLISEAGGDGDPLDAIEARDKASDPLCESPCPSEECAAMQDRRTLLALVREQAAKLDAVRELTQAAWDGELYVLPGGYPSKPVEAFDLRRALGPTP